MRCWHELSKIFDEEIFEGIYSVLTTITPSNGLFSLANLINLSKSTGLTGSKRTWPQSSSFQFSLKSTNPLLSGERRKDQ